MTRTLLPYFNATSDGQGLEGLFKWVNNTATNNLFLPAFLLVFYVLSIYALSKSENKLGVSLLFVSLVFFILAMIGQTYSLFSQMVIFIFALGMVGGIVVSFIENAK
jgi:hypothetical protein